jgi:D-glucosaminate-6-phosphate ammonia-lyase
MAGIYERLGVPVIINAKGTSTRVSGGIMAPEVADAMREASQHCVDMWQLHGRASEIIAGVTGAEAGLVTSGAAAGLLLGTAACLAGLDPTRMNRLPDTGGMKDEVLVPRSHRNAYDHAIRTAGATLVEVGIPDRFSGAGVRDTEPWELAAAIGEATAAVFYVAQAHALPPLPAVVAVAHEAGVPVLVDAASQVPPVGNLRRFIDEGADLVAFSGGKAIGGPQGSGILCGRRDLIASAALQSLDNDLYFEQWDPPAALIDKAALPGLPQHGIGRPCKAGKEEIVGLLTALARFTDEAVERERRAVWAERARALAEALRGIPHAEVIAVADGYRPGIPSVRLKLDEAAAGTTAYRLALALQYGAPSIQADVGHVGEGIVGFSAMCLEEGHPKAIAARVRAILGAGG